MAGKNFTLNFDASMNISQIRGALAEIQRSFSGLKLSQNLNTNIENTFKKINNELENFEKLSSRSVSSLSEVSKISNSFDKIVDYYRQLEKYNKEITGTDMKKFFPESVVNNINKAVKALDTYQKELSLIPGEIDRQNKALEKQEATLESLTQKRKALAAGNQSLGLTKGNISKKITAKESEQVNLTSQMSALEAAGVKKSAAEYKALSSQYSILTQEIKKLKAEIISIDSTIGKNRSTISDLDSQIKTTTENISNVKREISQMEQNLNSISLDKLRKSLADITDQDVSSIPTNIEDIKNMIDGMSAEELQKIEAAFNDIKTAADGAEAPIKTAKEDLDDFKNTAQTMSSTADEIKRLQNQVMDFFSMSNAVQLFRRTIQSAFDTVKELDAAMTETAVVTDFSVGDMWESLPQYTSTANELGATIQGVYETMTLFYQQGLNTTETFEIGTETLKMARIAGLDYAQTTDLMTSALRGFNMELNATSAQRINDVYSELAAITASDTEEIATAMTKTASIANSANMEFETTAALLAQMIETTRESPENLGTAMKTIIARFTEVKEDPLGIAEVEGEEVNINNIDAALKSVGISLKDVNREFRDLDDVFLELASKWDTLNIMQQRYVATTAAGSRQQSRFIAMMSDYERTMELVNAANNSAGASEEQFAKTMDSLESKLNKLKNAWDLFTMGIMDSSAIKFGVDLLTSILTVINNITDSLPGVTSGFAKLGIAVLGLKAGKSILSSLFGFVGKAFLQTGEEAGENLTKGLEKNLEKASIKTRTWAKTVNSQLKKNFQLGGQTFEGITKSFEQVPIEIQATMAARMPAVAKNIIEDFKAAINYESLNEEGRKKADELINGFEEGFSKGEIQKSLQTLTSSASLLNFEAFGGKNFNSSMKVSQKTVKSLDSSLSSLGSTIGTVGSAFYDFASILDGLGLGGLANTVRKIGSAFSSVGGIVSSVGAIITAAGVSAQAAWWWITIIVVAIAGLTAGIVALSNAAYNNSLEGRMEAAAEATERAKTTAEQAKESYDALLSGKDSYNNLQNSLNDLIEGTLEWKAALAESNQQVLELLSNYPDLAQYVSREDNGKLAISSEGWDKLIESEYSKVQNTSNSVLAAQIKETRLGLERNLKDLIESYNVTALEMVQSEDILEGYYNNPDFFDRVEIKREDVESGAISEERLRKIMTSYGYNPELGGYEATLESFMGEFDSGPIYEYSDALLEVSNQSSTLASNIYEMRDGLAQYDKEVAEQQIALRGLVENFMGGAASERVTNSELGNSLIDAFSSLPYDELEKEIENRTSELYSESIGNLQEMYTTLGGSLDSLDDSIKYDATKMAEEVAKLDITSVYREKMDSALTTLMSGGEESAEKFLSALSGNLGNLTDQEIAELSDSTQNVEQTLQEWAKEFGFTTEEGAADLEAFSEALGLSIETLTSAYSDGIKNLSSQRIDIYTNLGSMIARSGTFTDENGTVLNTQERDAEIAKWVSQFSMSQVKTLTGQGTAIQENLGIESLGVYLNQMTDFYKKIEDYGEGSIEELNSFLASIDFSNPITAADELITALDSANPAIKQMSNALLETGSSAMSSAEQVKYYIQSSEFEDVSEELSELAKTEEGIDSAKILELASSSSSLSTILKNTTVSASGLAKTLNALYTGKISTDSITAPLLEAISTMNQFDDMVSEAESTRANRDLGIDEGQFSDAIKSDKELIDTFLENGEYGNTQLKGLAEYYLGEDAIDATTSGEELLAVYDNLQDKLEGIGENTSEIWARMANNQEVIDSLNKAGISLTQLDSGAIHLDTHGKTTLETVQALAEAYGISEEYAKELLIDFSNYSADFKASMQITDFKAAMQDYVAGAVTVSNVEIDEGGKGPVESERKVFNNQQVQDMAAAADIDEIDAWREIASNLGVVTSGLTTIQQLQDAIGAKASILKVVDEEGNLNSISNISQQLNELSNKGQTWAAGFAENGIVSIESLTNALSEMGIEGDLATQVVQDQIAQLQDSDIKFTFDGLEIDKEAASTNLQGEIDETIQSADFSGLADAIADAFSNIDLSEGAQAAVDKLGEIKDVAETATSEANTAFEELKTPDVGGELNKNVTEGARSAAQAAQAELNGIKAPNITIGVGLSAHNLSISGDKGSINFSINAYAKGSGGVSKNQEALLGDGGGPELVVSQDGTAKVVGTNGPTIDSLKKGDVVYTAEETEKILNGNDKSFFKAYGKGTAFTKKPPTQGGSSSSGSGSGGSSNASSNNSTSSSSGGDVEEETEIWENTFDWLYNLTQDINEELREREKLEREYNRLIENRNKSATDILQNIREQEASLREQQKLQQEMYDKRKQEMQRTLDEYSDVSQYGTYNWEDNTVEIDWDAIDQVTDTETGDRIEEYISKLEEIESQMDDAEDALEDIVDEIEELQKVGQDEYNDLENRVLNAIISREQEKIDKLNLIDESINDANNKLLDSIQSNLERIRQERQNQETEQSIADNERRLAYLQQDTSGANALEIQQLQEELVNQKQDYTDTLIDQKLSAIQEQNDKASEERQYQIELAQAQLEEMQRNGDFWNEAYQLIKEGTDATGRLITNSQLTNLLKSQEGWAAMSNIQQMDWLSELENNTKAAMVYFSNQRQLEKVGKTSGTITFTNASGETLTGTVQKDGSVKVSTDEGTYTYKEVFQNYDGTYETLESNPTFTAKPKPNPPSISSGKEIKVGGLINAGKAPIYDYVGDKNGETQYFSNDPIYKVLDEQNGYLLTRWHKSSSGYTGWFKKSDVKAYAKGGIADFTGPAWLDGTKSKPELVLNARDTENFIQLKDILSSLLKGDTSSGNSGDNYFEIHIDVDSLNNDYDVEQLATKIKKMINDDARYRNVNSINLLR